LSGQKTDAQPTATPFAIPARSIFDRSGRIQEHALAWRQSPIARPGSACDDARLMSTHDTPPENAEPDKRRVADQAYDALEAMISTLALKPGAPIVEAELIERTGLGRTPTREALMRLVSNGLIVQQPRRGLRVSEIRLAEHLDLIVEGQHVSSTRAYRALAGEAPAQDETLLQTALRVSF